MEQTKKFVCPECRLVYDVGLDRDLTLPCRMCFRERLVEEKRGRERQDMGLWYLTAVVRSFAVLWLLFGVPYGRAGSEFWGHLAGVLFLLLFTEYTRVFRRVARDVSELKRALAGSSTSGDVDDTDETMFADDQFRSAPEPGKG